MTRPEPLPDTCCSRDLLVIRELSSRLEAGESTALDGGRERRRDNRRGVGDAHRPILRAIRLQRRHPERVAVRAGRALEDPQLAEELLCEPA